MPALCQVWSHVIHAAVGDHLGALGHFRDATHEPPHVDWLVSGSGLDAMNEALKCEAEARSRA